MPLGSFERRGLGKENGSEGRISGGMARLTVFITVKAVIVLVSSVYFRGGQCI